MFIKETWDNQNINNYPYLDQARKSHQYDLSTLQATANVIQGVSGEHFEQFIAELSADLSVGEKAPA
jgi:hypothetical protein